MHELTKRKLVTNVKAAKRLIDKQDDKVFDVLEDVIKEHLSC